MFDRVLNTLLRGHLQKNISLHLRKYVNPTYLAILLAIAVDDDGV